MRRIVLVRSLGGGVSKILLLVCSWYVRSSFLSSEDNSTRKSLSRNCRVFCLDLDQRSILGSIEWLCLSSSQILLFVGSWYVRGSLISGKHNSTRKSLRGNYRLLCLDLDQRYVLRFICLWSSQILLFVCSWYVRSSLFSSEDNSTWKSLSGNCRIFCLDLDQRYVLRSIKGLCLSSSQVLLLVCSWYVRSSFLCSENNSTRKSLSGNYRLLCLDLDQRYVLGSIKWLCLSSSQILLFVCSWDIGSLFCRSEDNRTWQCFY